MKALICFVVAQSAALPIGDAKAVDPRAFGLPHSAFVVETQKLPTPDARDRALVLWMLAPARHPRMDPDDPYTCPEQARGHYFAGRTRVSLIDLAGRRVINTVLIRDVHFPKKDSFDTPYLIRSDLFYKVERTDDHGEGRPTILHMQDRTGDGKPFEFALYDAVFCMGLETALIGYSEKRDRIVQYPVDLTIEHAGSRTTVSRLWTDYLLITVDAVDASIHTTCATCQPPSVSQGHSGRPTVLRRSLPLAIPDIGDERSGSWL
jgi:hypothetical protein